MTVVEIEEVRDVSAAHPTVHHVHPEDWSRAWCGDETFGVLSWHLAMTCLKCHALQADTPPEHVSAEATK